MGRLLRACAVDELADGEIRELSDAPLPLAICRAGAEWFAFENRCTHEDFPLTDGAVDALEIECPLHGARFCLRSGAARAAPGSTPIRVYPVRVDNDEVLIDLTDS